MRRTWALSAMLAVGCASMEERMVFRPRPFDAAREPEGHRPVEIELTTASQRKAHARWYPQAGASGAILYCPGNAGNMQSRAAAVQELWVALGQSVLLFDYPGYGKSEGTPSESACYEAADAAYRWLTREAKVPPERIVLFGESLGGAVAVDLASREPHAALILARTFTSAPDVADHQMPLFPAHWVMSNRFDSEAKLPRCKQPTLILAAERDAMIPLRQAEKLRRACGGTAEVVVIPNLGHNDPFPTDVFPTLRTFLAQKAGAGWVVSR